MQKENMCQRLMSLGLPKTASHQLVVTLERWTQCSGTEWTISRLKCVKLIYLSSLANTPYKPDIRIKLRDGIPTGALRPLFSMSKKNLSKVLTALNSYSMYVSPVVTAKQKKKFFGSMESKSVKGMISRLKPVYPPNHGFKMPPHLFAYCQSNRSAPHSVGTGPESDIVECFLHGAESEPVREIVRKYEDYFKYIVPIVPFKLAPSPVTDGVRGRVLGTISAVQEPGFKLRAIANPSRILQCALEPLKNEINRELKSISTDFTHDQSGAIPIIQGWLKEERTVHSVDLSDATNLFPWPMQKALLEESFPTLLHIIQIMDECATGPWSTTLKGNGPEIVWFNRGQPLGLGPSFSAFAYTHNTLLEGICRKHGLPSDFCVLGDDVCIGNNTLHTVYLKTLGNLGCEVSKDKSFSSNTLAEFAGVTILRDRIGHAYKWRSVSDHSFMDFAKNLGPQSLGYLKPYQRTIAMYLSDFPVVLGGLGWSAGKNLDQLFESEKGNLILDYLAISDKRDETTIMRDLSVDVRSMLRDARIPFLPPLEEMKEGKVQGLDPLSYYFDPYDLPGRRFGTAMYPPIVEIDKEHEQGFYNAGYYKSIPRLGDPRPGLSKLGKFLESRVKDPKVAKAFRHLLKLPIDRKRMAVTKKVKQDVTILDKPPQVKVENVKPTKNSRRMRR